MATRVCLAGATGWAGSELARGIARADDVALVAAVSRTHAGRVLGEVLGEPGLACPVYASAAEALARPCDVFVEYTKPDTAKANVLAALENGAHVVVGTSGLTDEDYAEIDAAADPAVGDHRLRARRQARRAERHRPRACGAPGEGARSRAHGAGGPDRRGARRPRRGGVGVAGPLRAPPRLRHQRGGHLRNPGPEADHPPRRGDQRPAVRGGRAVVDPEGAHADRSSPGAGHGARSLSRLRVARTSHGRRGHRCRAATTDYPVQAEVR